MLNEIETQRKNELMALLDNRTITNLDLNELRELTQKAASNLVIVTTNKAVA